MNRVQAESQSGAGGSVCSRRQDDLGSLLRCFAPGFAPFFFFSGIVWLHWRVNISKASTCAAADSTQRAEASAVQNQH